MVAWLDGCSDEEKRKRGRLCEEMEEKEEEDDEGEREKKMGWMSKGEGKGGEEEEMCDD